MQTDNPKLKSYQHDSLATKDTIRLVEFTDTSSNGNELSIRLISTSVHTPPSYLALSYCWGANVQPVPINCDGMSLLISPSLHEAMLCLRTFIEKGGNGDGHSYCWIDQICINQGDLDERAQQVQIMGQIYRNAIMTVIWVGRADDYVDDKLFTFLSRVNDARRKTEELASNTHGYHKSDPESKGITADRNKELGLPEFESREWSDLNRLISRPWFNRVWVIQEAVLSRQSPILLCGKHDYPWDDFSTAIDWLDDNSYHSVTTFSFYSMTPFFIAKARRLRCSVSNDLRQWSLEAMLLKVVNVGATNPRDQIYGLLGMACDLGSGTDADTARLIPDYRADYRLLFRDVVRYCIKKSKRLWILRVGGVPSPGCEGDHTSSQDSNGNSTPSWAPRWDIEYSQGASKSIPTTFSPFVGEDGHIQINVNSLHNASLGLPVDFNPAEEDENVLSLKGIELEQILYCSDTIQREDMYEYETLPIRRLWEESLRHLNLRPDFSNGADSSTFMEFARSFYLAICCGETQDGKPAGNEPLSNLWHCIYNCYRESSAVDSISSDLLEQYRLGSQGGDDDKIMAFLPGRRFFVTTSGNAGLGGAQSQAGDRIFVLFGGVTLYALRKLVDGHKDGYLFLGEAYVAGLMNGEATQRWKDSNSSRQWVDIY